jgi:hypothetical protein
MNRLACFGLVALLGAPGPAFGLVFFTLGNAPLAGYTPEIRTLVNVEERVCLADHEGNLTFYFKGGPKALNHALRNFPAIAAAKREIIVLPGPAKPLTYDKAPMAYDWSLFLPSGPDGLAAPADPKVTLTVYIAEPLPPALADKKAARKWIADLGSDDFKIRDRASQELAELGPAAAAELRAALAGKPSAEARDRIERLLDSVSQVIRPDVLELPAGVSVVCLDDFLAGDRKDLTSKDPQVRAHGARWIGYRDAPAEEVLPDLEKVLRAETEPSVLVGAAYAAYYLGPAAKPLLPALRDAAARAGKTHANVFTQAIERVEKGTAEPVPEAEAKRWSAVRKGIRDLLAGRAEAAGR